MSSAHLPNGALEFGNLLGNSKKNFGILEFPRKFQNSKVFWKMFWNSRKNIGILEFPFQKKVWNFGIPWEIPKKNFGILEFPRKFQNSKIPKFFGRCFGIQEKILEFWNFLGNSKKKNFGILEFPGKFQKKTLEFWNSLENFKKNFGILEFWNFRTNSKIPKFF